MARGIDAAAHRGALDAGGVSAGLSPGRASSPKERFTLALASVPSDRIKKADAPKAASLKLLIVVPEAFQSALAPYLAHRRREMAVEVAPLGAVLVSSAGIDDPEKLTPSTRKKRGV